MYSYEVQCIRTATANVRDLCGRVGSASAVSVRGTPAATVSTFDKFALAPRVQHSRQRIG